MAKKKKTEIKAEIVEAEIKDQLIVDTLETNYMPYAMSVILSRAIPEIDGFKPAHRKLLYTMYKIRKRLRRDDEVKPARRPVYL